MLHTRDNRTLIRSGDAWLVGWSRSMLYSGFSILPRSVFWSADFNGRSDNLDVIPPRRRCVLGQNNGIHQIVSLVVLGISIWALVYTSGLLWVVSAIFLALSVVWFLFIGHGFIYPGLLVYAILDLFTDKEPED